MKRLQMRERAFKRLAFYTTLAGLVLMAVGLQQLLFSGRWILFLVLFVAGGALALISVVVDIVPESGYTVTLYTREGCTLCEEARAFLVGKKAEYDYDLWEVNIDQDAEANARYSDWVPVATVGETELFRLQLDAVRTEQKLRELADKRVRR